MKIELENSAKIAPYVKKSLKQDRGGTTWRCRFTVKDKRVKFSANPHENQDEAYVTINRKIHTAINGDKIESKRSTAPTVAEVVAAYLGAKPSSIDADHDTRKNNVSALRIVTRGVVSGSEPVIVKNKDGSYELTEPGFWSNLRLGKLTKKVGKDFLDQRVEGYKKGTTSFDERGRGANDVLRHARGVFTQKAINEVYVEQFKQSDLEALEDKKTGFLKVPFLKVRKPKWKALPQSVVDQILAKVPALETEDPDLYATFLLEFGCGLSWEKVLHAQYSWLDESPQPFENDETRYVINVQPTDGWVPKCQDRERSSTVPANIFQKLLDLRLAPRAPREDRKSGVTVSDEELARLVWSEPAVAVGKRFESHQQPSKTTARGAASQHLKVVSGLRCSAARWSTRTVNCQKKSASGSSYALSKRQHQRMITSSSVIAVKGSPAPTVAWLVGSAPTSKGGTGNKSDTSSVN